MRIWDLTNNKSNHWNQWSLIETKIAIYLHVRSVIINNEFYIIGGINSNKHYKWMIKIKYLYNYIK